MLQLRMNGQGMRLRVIRCYNGAYYVGRMEGVRRVLQKRPWLYIQS